MKWRLAGPEALAAVDAWIGAEDPEDDLRDHVVEWLLRLGEVGPRGSYGARIAEDGDRWSILVQETIVQVDFVASSTNGDIRVARIGRRMRR